MNFRKNPRYALFLFGLCVTLSIGTSLFRLSAQDYSVSTFGSIIIESPGVPGVIELRPPSTAITSYTLIWPADPPSTNHRLIVNSGADPFQLNWATSTGDVMQLVSSGNMNLRRASSTLEPPSPPGTPGYISNDFQGVRSSTSQTASNDRAVILGGGYNQASGSRSSVGGGQGNSATNTHGVTVGGSGNTVTSSQGAILGGASNTTGNNNSVVFGGQGNTSSSSVGFLGGGTGNTTTSTNAMLGGGAANSLTGNQSVIFGGYNITNSASGSGSVVFGGGFNFMGASNPGAIIGGGNNSATGNRPWIGGGYQNTVSADNPTTFGGRQNTVSVQRGTILGGRANNVASSHSCIPGGESNAVTAGSFGIVWSGSNNSISNSRGVVLGGTGNTTTTDGSVAAGQSATSSSTYSAVFNGGTTALTVSTVRTFTLCNMDVWLVTNNNSPSEIRFFEIYNTAGSYPGSVNYVALKAPVSMDADNDFTLPDRVGSALDALSLAYSPTPTSAQANLTWTKDGYRTHAQNITANNITITAANMDNRHMLRLTANNTPPNRRVILQNGVRGGLVLAIRVLSSTGGTNPDRGIRLAAGDANLALSGNVNANLDHMDTIQLVWDPVDSVWIEIGRTVQ